MIDKHEYYHGAAIVRLLHDERCIALQKKGLLGYVVNEDTFLFIKYTTKNRTSWRFTFDQEDVNRANLMAEKYTRVIVPMVCGGDGICALTWGETQRLLGNAPGFIAIARKHNEQYGVWGSVDELKNKISLRRWPDIALQNPEPIISAAPQLTATAIHHD